MMCTNLANSCKLQLAACSNFKKNSVLSHDAVRIAFKLSTCGQSLYLWTLVYWWVLLHQLVLIQVVLLLVSPSYTPLGRDLDSTFHYSHMLHCDMMEQALVADTGRLYLSSLQYWCMLPQLLHLPEWEDLHSQHSWLENKKKYWMILHVETSQIHLCLNLQHV